jgi:NADH-quinone oxidoreductase subunit L
MEILLERALLWIVLLPLAGALINGTLGRRASRAAVHTVAVASVAISFLLGLAGLIFLLSRRLDGVEDPSIVYTFYQWFSINVGSVEVPVFIRFVMDPLGAVMTLVVAGVGLLIHIYACGYMAEDPDYSRFFCFMNLFMGSMLILVLGSSIPVMFIGWEGVGLCSYLLIGFWFENRDFAAAGRKAFVTNRIGDFGALIGMFLLVQATGSFEFAAINGQASRLAELPAFGSETLGLSVATAAALFLFLACTGKSAQIPLFVWLPDAMAGPTPVSALIHAATMVTSGVYLICRLSPLYAATPAAMAVVASVGAATAFVAATIALVQNNMKRILAYSTVSQLGFMFAAVGSGAFAAGIYHVYTHAFFKACLFLGAGSVMHAVGAHGDADIRQLGGLRKFQPRTNWTFLVSCAAIAGVPFFSGFFSKDEILVGALGSTEYFGFAPWLGWALFGTLVVAATMTAFYMFRLYFVTFWNGEYRGGPAHEHGDEAHAEEAHAEEEHAEEEHAEEAGHDAHAHHGPHESPDSMTLVLVVLAIGAAVAGYLWIGALGLLDVHFDPWVQWLESSLGSTGVEHHTSHIAWALLCGTAAAAVGIYLAWLWYFKPGVETPKNLAENNPAVYRFLLDKWRVDELYDATVLGASRGLGVASAQVDKNFIDGILAWVSSQGVRLTSFLFTRIQTGVVHAYGAFMMVGLLALAWWFLAPHPHIGVHLDENTRLASDPVRFEAGEGLGYQYRWDFDSDGRYDTGWQSAGKQSHSYSEQELRKGAVVVVEPGSYGFSIRTDRLCPGEELHLDPDMLGSWRREEADFATRHPDLVGVPAQVVADEKGLLVRPNGALVRTRQGLADCEQQLRVGLGEQLQIGDARLTVAGKARATLRVRNAVGWEREVSLDLGLQRGARHGRAQARLGGGR